MKTILSILLVTFLCGCASTSTGTATKSSAKEIAVFQMGSQPTQQFVVLGTLKDDATEKEEDEIVEEFKKKARKMGGDAIFIAIKNRAAWRPARSVLGNWTTPIGTLWM